MVHQLPVETAGGNGWVIRAYGVEDDPKQPLEKATWFNRPMAGDAGTARADERGNLEAVEKRRRYGMRALFPVTTPDEAWACARWMMGYASGYGVERWRAARRLSLAESAHCADGKALAEARNRRLQGIWQELWLSWRRLARTCGRCWRICRDWRRQPRRGVRCAPCWGIAQGQRGEFDAGRQPCWCRRRGCWTVRGFEQEAALAEGEAFTCIQDAVREGTGRR